MLRFLKIRDFALIRDLQIEFDRGLNLLTGETGSGKSILVDALGLLLGGRSSQDLVRTKADTAVLEAIFTVGPDSVIHDILTQAGIDCDDDTVIIRRDIATTGRSRIFIQDSPATLTLLKALGTHLARIHGQQDHHALLELDTHLEWLDRFGSNQEACAEVRGRFVELRNTADRIRSLQISEQDRLRKIDILQFQLSEIRRADLQPGESEELEQERTLLANHEKIFSLSSEAYSSLYESGHSILSQAKRLERVLTELEEFDSRWSETRKSLGETLYLLEDLSLALRDYHAGLEFSPQRLDAVQRRLAEIERLAGKYGRSVSEILGHAASCEKELAELLDHEESMGNLKSRLAENLQLYLSAAGRLSKKRRADADLLEREIRKEFRALSMEKMKLEIRFHPKGGRANAATIPPECGPDGIDKVEFYLAPNLGEEMRPLAKIASGGELSRILLAIQVICGGGDPGSTMVFDEVDAGIGGRVAEAVGRRLARVSRDHQVLCVTHLPQIAAYADRHLFVKKDLSGSRTETQVRALDGKDREEEVARMLGGAVITDTTRRHAREVLTMSAEHKGQVKGKAR